MAARDERAAFDLGLFWSKAGAEWGSLGLKCVLRLKLWWMKRHRDRGVKNDQG